MKVNGVPYRSIWFDDAAGQVRIIDQRWLPHDFRVATLESREEFATAIRDMWVRGAPLIGATAAYGVARDMARDPSDANLDACWTALNATRPTAINLRWALDRCRGALRPMRPEARAEAALRLAHEIADEDVEINRRIGVNGLAIIREIAARKPAGEPVRLLTHCNAGWLATVDWGTATSPMYHAAEAGIPIHVWVDETRPRNQGALTALELGSMEISTHYVPDNAGGPVRTVWRAGDTRHLTGPRRATCATRSGTLIIKAPPPRTRAVYVALPPPPSTGRCRGNARSPYDGPSRPRGEPMCRHRRGRRQSRACGVPRPKGSRRQPGLRSQRAPRGLVTGLITELGVGRGFRGPGLAAMLTRQGGLMIENRLVAGRGGPLGSRRRARTPPTGPLPCASTSSQADRIRSGPW